MCKCNTLTHYRVLIRAKSSLGKKGQQACHLSCSLMTWTESYHVPAYIPLLIPLLEEHAVLTGRFATKPSVEAADRRERTAARKADFMVAWR